MSRLHSRHQSKEGEEEIEIAAVEYFRDHAREIMS